MTPYEARCKNSKNPSFSQCLHGDTNIEEDWKLFKYALMTSVDRNIPSKMVSDRNKFPWLSARKQHDCAALSDAGIESTRNIRRLVTTG